ncbi:integrase [Cereibacter sphaeroides]|nr:integrase [Cereibacter sphaeroides]AZB60952.1 integrase [Cereibacter sphaeroides]
MTLEHLQKARSGKWQYRRRIPKEAQERAGMKTFKRVLEATSGASLRREYGQLETEFERLVSVVAPAPAPWRPAATATPREEWQAAKTEAEALVSQGGTGLDEDELRDHLAEEMHRQGRPAVVQALKEPPAVPKHTLEDARKLYLKEKLAGGEGDDNRSAAIRLERIFARVRKALGERVRTCPLEDLKREDARAVRDHMLSSERSGGGTLSPASVRRELNVLVAVVNFGLTEFDLRGKAVNPFEKLKIAGSEVGVADLDEDKRDPLPAEVITAMAARLAAPATRSDSVLTEIRLIWRLLVGTGCRLSEVVGLRVQDVKLSGAIPHIRVTWHEDRRLKTKASIRSVPLLGDALEAAQEALKLPRKGNMVFERYARPRGADSASAALMKHVRKETTNPRHVVHSLRHNMKDSLRLAGVEKTVQDLVLGHASSSIGEIYGGEAARLEVAHRALLKVAERA